jgi:hypothetical protein
MKSGVKSHFQPAFLICAVVLGVAGVCKTMAIEWIGIQTEKLPFELQKSLSLMDESALGSYRVVSKHKVENKDVLKELGTDEYLQWQLEDIDEAEGSAVRHCSLFITYYNRPDRVPHVPEECYVGGGNQQLARESIVLKVRKDPDDKEIATRYLVFVQKSLNMWASNSKYSVLYVFNVNGEYANDRTEVRNILGRNLFGKYSYFSKIEWRFYGRSLGNLSVPSKEESIQASEKLLGVLLPVLENEHWPDWEEANRRE